MQFGPPLADAAAREGGHLIALWGGRDKEGEGREGDRL